ncbi:MAG: septum formation initiator family protein [Fusicatenibacter sp.]|nr:septum formation initiator family protein [Fusicatenibacter sp.]
MGNRAGKSQRHRARENQKQNRYAMASIILVACILLAVLFVKGYSLQKRIDENSARQAALQEEIEKENSRTEEISALKEYMQSDEYIEKMAREKLGMVKENEILFKESK